MEPMGRFTGNSRLYEQSCTVGYVLAMERQRRMMGVRMDESIRAPSTKPSID